MSSSSHTLPHVSARGAILSQRTVQPGNQVRSRWSEKEDAAFEQIANFFVDEYGLTEVSATSQKRVLADSDGVVQWSIERGGKLLRNVYGTALNSRSHGLKPEFEIIHVPSGKPIFVEVKFQGARGNAHERIGKLFTTRMSRLLQEHLGIEYHPYVAVMTGHLATDDRYLMEFDAWFEPYQCALMPGDPTTGYEVSDLCRVFRAFVTEVMEIAPSA